MKTIVYNLKKEFAVPSNVTAAICCLILSISIFFIMGVINRDMLL
ncbi:hypothetical protein [uncultured Allomuricauda sp.]|nr:hypothetical protein [uncultured Allomuricauda sp.]